MCSILFSKWEIVHWNNALPLVCMGSWQWDGGSLAYVGYTSHFEPDKGGKWRVVRLRGGGRRWGEDCPVALVYSSLAGEVWCMECGIEGELVFDRIWYLLL